MTVKTATIKVNVETNAEGAARGFDRLGGSTDKSRKAVERLSPALKAARLEYQVAQARAENLATAQAKLTAKTLEAGRAFDRAAAAAAKGAAMNASSGSAWGSLAGGVGKAAGALGLATAVGAGAVTMASDLAAESIKVQGVFANLPFALDPARTATRGLADDMTLARLSIMANQSGVAKSAQSFGELAGMAQTLAFKMGRDVNDTIERVTMGIAKQEREILDELVILPKMEEMWRLHAITLGKTTAELSDHEKTAAFTESALQALRAATQGVEVDMGGAAGAIAKATVQAKNLQTALLGGREAEVSLRDGVASLDTKVLAQVKNLQTYRSSFYEVSDALEQAGVNVDAYRNNAVALEQAITKVSKADAQRIVDIAEEGKLTTDLVDDIERLRTIKGALSELDERIIYSDLKRLDLENEHERVAARAAAAEVAQRSERLREIEEQLAFGRAAQISQKEINALVAEEAELRALVLEAEGKGAEAGEVRRKAQLDALAAVGESSRPRRGGGHRRADNGEAARREAVEQQRKTAEEIDALMMSMHRRRLDRAAELNPFSEENLESQAEAEAARLAALDEAEAAYHEAAMARLEERQRKEAEAHAFKVSVTQESMDLALGAAAAIVQGAVIEGQALRTVVANTAKGEAMRHGLILGPSALAGAAFNYAWGNIPQATALAASAAQSFAFAAAMGMLGGAVGAFGGHGSGRGKHVAGFGAEAFGGGPAANDAPRSASGGGWDIGGSVPLSQEKKQRASASAMIGSAWSSGPVMNQTNHIYATGEMDDMTIRKIVQGVRRSEARQGRLTAGGRG